MLSHDKLNQIKNELLNLLYPFQQFNFIHNAYQQILNITVDQKDPLPVLTELNHIVFNLPDFSTISLSLPLFAPHVLTRNIQSAKSVMSQASAEAGITPHLKF